MPVIQIDMFEVQLGAAILLQFRLDGRTVRVLADAGVKASKYPPTHVRDKLIASLPPDDRRIDLIIGTHYDEDHLNGLAPVIDDPRFQVGEAWLPPVANDTQVFPLDLALTAANLLPHQFASETGEATFQSYIDRKRADISGLRVVGLKGNEEAYKFEAQHFVDHQGDELAFFRFHAGRQDEQCGHCNNLDAELPDDLDELVDTQLRRMNNVYRFASKTTFTNLAANLEHIMSPNSEIAAGQFRTIDNIRKGAAEDAINAKALFDVVKALQRRSIPFKTEIVPDGTPRFYRWNATSGKFTLSRDTGDGLAFTLLGPSQSLVRKHRDRLPVVEYAKAAFFFLGEIRSITPSNQLSYIGCFQFAGQRILISGDAGCVDFKQDGKSYYPQLLAQLKPLHVVQVAHHGGNNAHFYRVLSAAEYDKQDDVSYLLLSHAENDRTRPSDVFRDFLLTARNEGDDIRLLFTSQPTKDKVVDYLDAIHPTVGGVAPKGDVQLAFKNSAWQVTSHAIKVI